MPNYRKQIIENMFNDEAQQITPSLFKWRNLYYEIIPYKEIKKRGYSYDSFIKIPTNKTLYGLRQLSLSLIKKYYSSVLDK